MTMFKKKKSKNLSLCFLLPELAVSIYSCIAKGKFTTFYVYLRTLALFSLIYSDFLYIFIGLFLSNFQLLKIFFVLLVKLKSRIQLS